MFSNSRTLPADLRGAVGRLRFLADAPEAAELMAEPLQLTAGEKP
jgi:hypothetical protein